MSDKRKRSRPRNQGVNRVPRKADEQDISLERGRVSPEDDTHSTRQRKTELKVGHTRKPKIEEEIEIHKGRPLPKEKPKKEPYDRHAPRKTDIEKQYTKELQKLRNKLKYREKQGFFVRWEDLPSRDLHPTVESIEKIKNYEVVMNELGEITLHQKEMKQADVEKLRLPKDLLPSSLFVHNENDFAPPEESDGEFDTAEYIEEQLYEYSLRVSVGEKPEDFLRGKGFMEWSIDEEKVQSLMDGLKLIRMVRERYPANLLEAYYRNHKEEITSIIVSIYHASRIEQVVQGRGELLRYIEPH